MHLSRKKVTPNGLPQATPYLTVIKRISRNMTARAREFLSTFAHQTGRRPAADDNILV